MNRDNRETMVMIGFMLGSLLPSTGLGFLVYVATSNENLAAGIGFMSAIPFGLLVAQIFNLLTKPTE